MWFAQEVRASHGTLFHSAAAVIVMTTTTIDGPFLLSFVTMMAAVRLLAAGALMSLERIRLSHPAEARRVAENVASLEPDDGWAMMKAVKDLPAYRGAMPLYSSLWLQATPLMDHEVAALLGVSVARVKGWRATMVFDPLTGGRVRARLGNWTGGGLGNP